MRRLWLGLGAIGMTAGLWLGCSSTGGGGGTVGPDGGAATGQGGHAANGGSGTGGSAAKGGTSGSGASAASGGSAAGGSGGAAGGSDDAGLPDVQFTYDGPGTEQDACAAVTVQAQLVPLDLYVVLDRSGSMVNSALGTLRWPPVRDALNTFFQSPQAAGIGVALTMFASPTGNECVAPTYATPLVPMAPLPGSATGQAITLQNTMNQYAPVLGVGTPTTAAVTGAVTFTQAFKTQNPGRTVAIVLATDGLPGDSFCNSETPQDVQNAVAAGYNGTPSIRTFVIGIDPTTEMQTNLSAWATAGGGQFFDVGTSGGPAQFLAAMKNIQGSLLGCTFSMPTTDAGIIEPQKVKVKYTPGAGSPSELPRVNDKTACSGPGWYYDNNANPTTIELCDGSCTTVQADPAAAIDIELGCLGS